MEYSLDEIKSVAESLIKKAIEKKIDGFATILLLEGELGAGKTTLVQNIGKVFGIEEKIASPTFVIQKRYEIKNSSYELDTMVHMDAYRLAEEKNLEVLDFGKIMKNEKNFVVIEWPELIKEHLPESALWIRLEIKGENEREIVFK
ncbi:tRNA (adenosine(37)-N6)-threonylcarbamoyltransferase complex ATPase subunit type 1 TsaE [Candidatus Nomurabacteria bacterium]|nr:tRNA (adenosine(37)-N6)-threonylcarbamoyltransferase complex ATPase subunit type 1 TsaE [Candidatus Nomurabacteria bacterium]USN94654.1 MAG: tRNA (adenosine(37)-N6)-threonylcarbamoyltransferase complex ATPase subunit type 1 TsaE [Candidatus Nomurabacteria bacterium]